MPLYSYKCVNKKCNTFNEVRRLILRGDHQIPKCVDCRKDLQRVLPNKLHVTGVGKEIDGKDLGKVTQEKNEQLKSKWSGYSYEEQNLRKSINEMVENKQKESK